MITKSTTMTSEDVHPELMPLNVHEKLFPIYTVFVVLLISNLNALVDAFMHPDIPYFDHEHLIVGGISGTVTAVFMILLWRYVHRLRRAILKIRKLEKFLPICSHCRKIRKPHSDPDQAEAWLPMETYFREHTDSQFSHGICPDCMTNLYSELDQDKMP